MKMHEDKGFTRNEWMLMRFALQHEVDRLWEDKYRMVCVLDRGEDWEHFYEKVCSEYDRYKSVLEKVQEQNRKMMDYKDNPYV